MTNEVLSKIKLWLQNEVDRTELCEEDFCENKEDFIHYGRQECAIDLLTLIKQIEKGDIDDVKFHIQKT